MEQTDWEGDYLIMYEPALEFFEKMILYRTMSAKNTKIFFTLDMVLLLEIFGKGMPVHAHVFSFRGLHIMQWFSHTLDAFTLKIRQKSFDFNIFMNKEKMSLSEDLKVIACPMYLYGLVQRTVMTGLTIFNLHC